MRIRTLLACLTIAGLAVSAVAYTAACVSNTTVDTTCPTYCQDIQANCTGDDTQYPTTDSNQTCLNVCAAMQPGTPGVGGSDTVACREGNVSLSKDAPTTIEHHNDCVAGGLSAMNCAPDQCTAFCTLALALCTTADGGTLTGYANTADCVTACKTWGASFDGGLLGSTGDTLQCRTYHLELSQTGNPADKLTHCPHTGVVSARCNNNGADAGTDSGTDAATDGPSE